MPVLDGYRRFHRKGFYPQQTEELLRIQEITNESRALSRRPELNGVLMLCTHDFPDPFSIDLHYRAGCYYWIWEGRLYVWRDRWVYSGKSGRALSNRVLALNWDGGDPTCLS